MTFRHNLWITIAVLALLLLNVKSILEAAERRVFISIPILAVSSEDEVAAGSISTLAIQVERQSAPLGLIIEFNEGSRAYGTFKGRALEEDSKEAARTAVLAASKIAGEDSETLRVTFKAVSNAYLIGGPSASASIAVAIIAALRGIRILPDVVITGATDVDGHILPVGGLPAKIHAAAAAGLTTVLIPAGQARTRDWDLLLLSESLGVTVVEVATVKDAYEKMTGRSF
jgi:predicted S18 family serine protease